MNLGNISSYDAYAHGLRPLAGPYNRTEGWMLNNVVADMERGKRRFALVSYPSRPSEKHVFVAPIASVVRTADSVE